MVQLTDQKLYKAIGNAGCLVMALVHGAGGAPSKVFDVAKEALAAGAVNENMYVLDHQKLAEAVSKVLYGIQGRLEFVGTLGKPKEGCINIAKVNSLSSHFVLVDSKSNVVYDSWNAQPFVGSFVNYRVYRSK